MRIVLLQSWQCDLKMVAMKNQGESFTKFEGRTTKKAVFMMRFEESKNAVFLDRCWTWFKEIT